MMALFLPVIVNKKNEQTNREKYVFYCSVSQIHINSEKTHEKDIKSTFCEVPNISLNAQVYCCVCAQRAIADHA